MFQLDVTKIVENLRNYYTCNKCGEECVFSNLQGRSCEKCDKPEGKCIKVDAFARISRILANFQTHKLTITPVKFSLNYKGNVTEWIVKEATAVEKQNPLGEIPLHAYCKKHQTVELEQSIVSDLYDINHKDFANWTPLHEAVESDFMEGVEILLKNGAVCDVPGMDYITPLHKACLNQNENIIKLLIAYGANVNITDSMGMRPFDHINNVNLRRKMEQFTKDKVVTPKTVYVTSTAKIFLCKNVDEDLKEQLSKWFPNYKLSQFKFATHIIAKGEKLSFEVVRGVLRRLVIYEQNKILSTGQNVLYTVNFAFIPSLKRCFKAALLSRFLGHPPLFDKISFHILEHNRPLEIEGLYLKTSDLVELVRSGGGEVLRREPTPTTSVQRTYSAYHLLEHPVLKNCTNFIIFDEREPPALLYSMKELHHKSSKWLIETILRYKFI